MKGVCISLLAGAVGCAFIQPVSAVEAAKAKILYSFCAQQNCTDGANPYASLIDVNGTLFGTTYDGGAHNVGAVFAFDPNTGVETTLYSFCSQRNCKDGQYPYASLTDVNGVLYGTTRSGGAHSSGTVFALDPNTGGESVVHSFTGLDGYAPLAGLIDIRDTMYGTTSEGGTYGNGTVFALSVTTGNEKVLYSFCSQGQGNCSDGAAPGASLVEVKGALYGTTIYGGGGYSSCQYGCGTVFSVDRNTGVETVLYTFCSQQNCTDGSLPPYAALINLNGTLYGTTQLGGLHNSGAAFEIDLSTDAETVLYSFCGQQNCTDGAAPRASLIDVKGTLYGTTSGGGTGTFGDGGTVFALDPNTGAETVLYSFCTRRNCPQGESPNAGLINVKGTLYGTAFYGGAYAGGTVFALRRP